MHWRQKCGEVFYVTISLELLLSELHIDLETPCSRNPSFSGFELFILGSSDFSGQTLLISKMSEALLVPKKDDLFFLCVRDRRQDELETEDSTRNICVVNRNMDQKELLNAVQRVFKRIQSWVLQMNDSVLANRGIQDLLELCEPIIGNHITIMDASYNLLAYTKNIETDDEVLNLLMSNGYHPEETIRSFVKHRRIEQFETADENELIISRDHLINQCDTVKKVYKYNGKFFAIVVMVCCSREYTEAMGELYKLLLKYITVYFEKDKPMYEKPRQLESFVSGLIGKTILDVEEARARAKSLNIPFEGSFELNLVVFNDIMNIPAIRLAQDLSPLLSDADVTVFSRDVLILRYITDSELETGDWREHLSGLLKDVNCTYGVSNVFESLWDISVAYAQAHAAVIVGERLRLAKKEKWSHRFYCYEDYYSHHLVFSILDTMPGVFTSCFAFNALNTLKKHGEKNNVCLIEILSAYLDSERNASRSSEKLHMHRNTILYHVRKIEDILGVSLDDPDVRMKLMIGLKAYDLDRL